MALYYCTSIIKLNLIYFFAVFQLFVITSWPIRTMQNPSTILLHSHLDVVHPGLTLKVVYVMQMMRFLWDIIHPTSKYMHLNSHVNSSASVFTKLSIFLL